MSNSVNASVSVGIPPAPRLSKQMEANLNLNVQQPGVYTSQPPQMNYNNNQHNQEYMQDNLETLMLL